MLAVVVFLTAGFQISCPPPESLEGIDADVNPAFHDGVNSGDFYSPPKIKAVAVDPRTGNFFVGGSFTSIDNVPAVNIAFYDKTRDRFYRLFGKGLKNSSDFQTSSVNALAIAGSYLYIGGSFSQTAASIPTTGLNHITRYYIGNGSLDDINEGYFEVLSNNGLNGEVFALEFFDNSVYVGGSFFNTSSGSVSNLNKIARYTINCSSDCWSAVHGGFNDTVYALEKGIYGNQAGDVLYIGGAFTQLLGSQLAVNHFTAYRPSDGAMIQFPGLNGTVKTLAYEERRLRIYAGGSFTADDGNTLNLNHVAYFSGGSSFQPLPENGLNGDVNALAVSGHLIFVGGDFTQTVSGVPSSFNRIALFDSHPNEEIWTNFADGLNDSVAALDIDDTTGSRKRLIVGGSFTRSGGNTGETLKRVTAFDFFEGQTGFNRSPDSNANVTVSLSPLGLPNGKGLNGTVNALAADASGNVYAGGLFTRTADGTANLNRIARYNPATKTWVALAGGGLNDNVEALAVVGDNLYVGGYFSATADGTVTNLNRIARYNLTTNTWFPVAGNGLFGFGAASVSAFAVKDNVLYVGGNFSRTFDNSVTNLNYIAAYDLTANIWSPLADGGLNANVNALAIVGDDLYIGGGFTRTFNNFYFLFRITRYNLTNQTWFEFANSGLDAEAKRLTVSGNYVFVNGFFSRTRDNTIILDSLARYDIANNSWTRMPGDAASRLAAIQTNSVLQVGSDLFVGGNFHGAGNNVAHFFTQIYLQKWNVPAATTDWFDGANWKLGVVPNNNSNAVVPGGAGQINIASADVTLNDFSFNGGTLTVASGRTLTVNGVLNLNGGIIVGGGTVVIANCRPEAVIGGDANGYIQTALVRCVNNSGTFDFPVGTTNAFSPITIKGITGAGNISVKANQGAYSNPADDLPANRLARWWRIENPGGGISNADLYFGYLQNDIAENETDYRAYRISGGAAQMVNGADNTFSNVVTANNVTGFSDWTLAQGAPTAAPVSVGGRVLAFKNRSGISGARVSITNQSGETRYVMTNPFGYYRLADVPAGETYIIGVSHKRFRFANSPVVRFVGEDLTDLNFSALP